MCPQTIRMEFRPRREDGAVQLSWARPQPELQADALEAAGVPGITGVWQVSGRSELGFGERLRLEIAYVRNRCISLDFSVASGVNTPYGCFKVTA